MKKQPSLSVCIPAYEMSGRGAAFLEDSFTSLASQTLQEFEIVVSDQSTNSEVKDLCEKWEKKLNIRHVWNKSESRNSSTNVNRAIRESKGEVKKILFQDDYLCDPKSLENISRCLSANSSPWILSGSGISSSGSTIERPMVPKMNTGIHFGNNTVSSPSVLSFHRKCTELFDTNLTWLMDVEFYWRLWSRYGDPIISPDLSVVNRIHENQVSAGISRKLQRNELDYVWRKHRSTTPLSGKYEYFRRRLKATILA